MPCCHLGSPVSRDRGGDDVDARIALRRRSPRLTPTTPSRRFASVSRPWSEPASPLPRFDPSPPWRGAPPPGPPAPPAPPARLASPARSPGWRGAARSACAAAPSAAFASSSASASPIPMGRWTRCRSRSASRYARARTELGLALRSGSDFSYLLPRIFLILTRTDASPARGRADDVPRPHRISFFGGMTGTTS